MSSHKNSSSLLIDQIDYIEKILAFSFKIGVFIGSFVLLSYCWKIGYYPQEISVGDGILFIILAVSFGVIYLFFVTCITSIGITLGFLLNPTLRFIFKLINKYEKTNHEEAIKKFNVPKANFHNYIFSLFGIIICINFSISDTDTIPKLMLSILGCTVCWSLYTINEVTISEFRLTEKEENLKSANHLITTQKFLLSGILLIPIIFGGFLGKILDGAFSISNARFNNINVHVREPYNIIAKESGYKCNQSSLGENYSKCEGITVLFTGIGKHTVINYKPNDKSLNLIIPSDDIILIKN